MYKLSIVAFVLGLFLLGTAITMKALPSAEASCNTSVNCDTFCVETEYCGLEAECINISTNCGLIVGDFCCYNAVGACEVSPFHRHYKGCCKTCPTNKQPCKDAITQGVNSNSDRSDAQ